MPQITILFTDIKDSTVIARALGGDQYKQLYGEHRKALDEEITRCGGTVHQDTGDGVNAYFRDPISAVLCANNLQTRFALQPTTATDDLKQTHWIRVRVGLDTQEVTAPDALPDRLLLSHAARVMSLADAGQVLLSESLYPLVKAGIADKTKEWKKRYLKGFDSTESVYEYLHDGIPRREPGTRFIPSEYVEAANAYIERTELERKISETFVVPHGRDDAALYRLVTIHGYGGMGKTRLAVYCAKHLAAFVPGGVYFVSLADLVTNDRASVANAIVQTIKIPMQPGDDSETRLVEWLKASPPTMLLLDNAESVAASEPCGFLLLRLLKEVRDLRLFVTSREKLQLTGEYPIDVNDGVSELEAIKIFRARAEEKSGNKPIPPADDPDLKTLVNLADRIPLAIEFLAANYGDFGTIAGLRDDYSQSRDLLNDRLTKNSENDGEDAAAQRHRSLTASLHWSWRLLGARQGGVNAQSLFLAASLFAEPMTDEALAAALGWDNRRTVTAATAALRNAALLRVRHGSNPTRYLMHRFSQMYGVEQRHRDAYDLTKPDEMAQLAQLPQLETLKQRLITYYKDSLQNHNEQLNKANGGAAREWFDNEWKNVIRAAEYAVEQIEPTAGISLYFSLSRFFSLRSQWKDGESVALKAYKLARSRIANAEEDSILGQTLNNLGNAYQTQGKWNEAEKAYYQSLQIFQSLSDKYAEGQTLNNLGNAYQTQGKWNEAEKAYYQSLQIFQSLSDKYAEGQTLNNLGSIHQSQGKWVEAEVKFIQSLTIKRFLGDKLGEGKTLNNLENVYQLQKRWDEAEEAFYQSLTIYRSLGDKLGEGQTLNNLGNVYQLQRRWDEAEKAYEADVAICRLISDKHGEAKTLFNLSINLNWVDSAGLAPLL